MQADLGNLYEGIKEVQAKMGPLELNSDAPATHFLGPTGSGKSTLINYILGANLTPERVNGEWKIRNESEGDYPVIGNKQTSRTKIPSVFDAEGMYMVDSAGFPDTKKGTQEIINSYANAKSFKRNEKTKIVLVMRKSSLF